ncbi:hypothetical protein OK351_03585 [Glutamicibacter sp. MNS18]|uniref:hypothetical protein n=1 Tax=Glutamicibacter sp. MNS18 TaxID=2989817 RepID=UPI0022358F47|nr:hypothetical protein [Glutamicibacter sp. MNS18]MCW4464589.1 hypothetical protein [Glutamicibacter sp. MNS18]
MAARQPSSSRKYLALSVGAALSLAACVSAADTERVEAEEHRIAAEQLGSTPATLLWQSTEELSSDALIVDELVLAYVHDRGTLRLLARELETGEERWQREARTGADPTGVRLQLETVTHNDAPTLAFLEPVGSEGTGVVVINALTGHAITSWGEDYWGSRPSSCDGSWCLDGINNPSFEEHTWRDLQLDWDTGRWDRLDPSELGTPRPEGSRIVGPGLSSTGERGPGEELLVFAKDGSIQWQHPYEEVFDSRYSTDSGWQWQGTADPERTLIGAGSRSHAVRSESTYLLDWSKDFMTVGLGEDTGDVLWRLPGGHPECGGAISDWVLDGRRSMVLCQFDSALGTVAEASGGTREQNITGLAWRAMAIDTWTGKELWSHPMPPLERFRELMAGQRRIVSDNDHAYLPMQDGWRAIEIASGTLKQPAEVYEPTVLCSVEREVFEFDDPHDEQGRHITLPAAIQPCDRETMEPVDSVPVYREFLRAGYGDQPHVALAGTEGLLVYRMPAPNREPAMPPRSP